MTRSFGVGLRVLVVDDEPDLCELLREVLESVGFVVATAATVAEAMKARAAASFDLIVTDKNLPDGTGLELAAAAPDDCEVVLVTGYGSLESAVEAMRVGVADYLTKPFDLETGLARIERVVNTLVLERRNRDLVAQLQDKNVELEERNAVLADLVVRDPLTGLFNHAYLQELIQQEVMRSQRQGAEFGLILLDIDHFQAINDTCGHATGDRVIRAAADLLRGEGRRSDVAIRLDRRDFAARFGGDEFVLILPDTSKRGAAAKAERLRKFIATYDFSAAGVAGIEVSVGVAACPADATDRGGLVGAAQGALAAAKRAGRNRVLAYTPSLAANGAGPIEGADLEIEQSLALDQSIAERAFRYVYQPIVRAGDGGIFAYEALCRPRHTRFTGPIELLATAERCGRIGDLGLVLRELGRAPLAALNPPMCLFINIHPLELTSELLAWGEHLGDDAGRIVLEITETAAVDDYGRARDLIQDLRQMGFRVALDDLGSGYAGLNSLARLSPDFAKLDMSILRGISSNGPRARLVRHLLEFAEEEGMQVVGEGIETAAERAVVRDLGCHLLQGFYFARPAPPFCNVQAA